MQQSEYLSSYGLVAPASGIGCWVLANPSHTNEH
jgi:hypothetical protein